MSIGKNQSVTWVEVDLSAIAHNIREIKRQTKGLPLMPVVKANAYGHGMVPVARACEKARVEYLGVISCEEALKLRRAKIQLPILVLSYVGLFLSKDLVVSCIEKNIEFSLFDLETAHFLSSMARRVKKKARIHIKVDTGTNRLGISPKNFFAFYDAVKKLPNVEIVGVFTHFAKAEEEDAKPTMRQTSSLAAIQKQLAKKEKKLPIFHAACSAALLSNPKTFFSMGRLGISLYGLWPDASLQKKFSDKIFLKPALSWKSKVIQVKKVKKGGQIGYGGTYTAPRDIMIAVVACGYADGYDRGISNRGYVLIHGKKAPIRGRICMNIMMVEVTDIPKVHQGSKVTLIGVDGNQAITATQLGSFAKTINYEIVTRINWNLPRFYKNT